MAINDIKKVRKTRQAALVKAAAAKAKPAAQAGVPAPGHHIFQCADVCAAMAACRDADAKNLDLEKPAIVNLGDIAVADVIGAEVKVTLGQLQQLMKEACAGKPGSQARAELGMDVAALAKTVDAVGKVMPNKMGFHKGSTDTIKTDANELTQALRKNMLATCFAVVKGHATFGAEKNFFPVLRVATLGTREVVLVPYAALAKFVQSTTAEVATESDVFSPKMKAACVQFMKFCTKEKFQQFLAASGGQAFCGTAGKSDCLYVPPGWMFAEMTKEFKCPIFMLEPFSQQFFENMKGSKAADVSRAADAYVQAVKAMQ